MTPVGQVVAVVNQKGGVGKTTVTTGLAAAARATGHRVLVIDVDPQAAATWMLGVDRVRRSTADALGSTRSGSLADVIVPSTWGHLVDIAPGDASLQRFEQIRGGLDTLLTGKTELRLRRALGDVARGYGVVLVDCPPSLGDLTTNALCAADQVVMVVEPTALSLRGVSPVADLIETVWDRHNQRLDLAGVIVNRMPARGGDAAAQFSELHRIVGSEAVWSPPVPNRIVIAEAASARVPIHDLGARGRDVAGVFDALYARLWELIRPTRP